MTTSLKAGDLAPEFSLLGDDDTTHTLASYRGKRVVLYFYPRDNTPGCTQEACDFRDSLLAKSLPADVVVLGVSPDSAETHRKFKQKFSLPFVLLADPGAEAAQKFGAWGEKNNYGKKSMGLIRSTFVIGSDGKLLGVFPKVSVKGHVEKVTALLGK